MLGYGPDGGILGWGGWWTIGWMMLGGVFWILVLALGIAVA